MRIVKAKSEMSAQEVYDEAIDKAWELYRVDINSMYVSIKVPAMKAYSALEDAAWRIKVASE